MQSRSGSSHHRPSDEEKSDSTFPHTAFCMGCCMKCSIVSCPSPSLRVPLGDAIVDPFSAQRSRPRDRIATTYAHLTFTHRANLTDNHIAAPINDWPWWQQKQVFGRRPRGPGSAIIPSTLAVNAHLSAVHSAGPWGALQAILARFQRHIFRVEQRK